LIAEQRRLWTTLIETLAVTIDARDQQTAGHSQRVTRYAEVIGRALGLAGIELEKLRAAALLHDYGKIAVRDEFRQKPGKLDDAEFAHMKAHAENTGEFRAHLEVPHDKRGVPIIAAQHHERMDAKGYPRLDADAGCVDGPLRRQHRVRGGARQHGFASHPRRGDGPTRARRVAHEWWRAAPVLGRPAPLASSLGPHPGHSLLPSGLRPEDVAPDQGAEAIAHDARAPRAGDGRPLLPGRSRRAAGADRGCRAR